MTFLPIVDRELRVAARSTATYRNRSLIAGAVAVVALGLLVLGGFGASLAALGGVMFKVLSTLTLLFCLLEGARTTADCLSEEKREGTLGLLFLTDLRAYDVVLGKLAGMSLTSFYGLIAIFPVLGLPMLLGGVTAGEYWRMTLALANILFFSLCAGLFVSSISREQQRALGGSLVVVGLCLLPLTVPNVRALSPVHAFGAAFQAYNRSPPAGYWQSIACGQILAWLFLALACFIVPRSWQEQEQQIKIERWWRQFGWRKGQTAARTKLRGELLGLNPIDWLVSRDERVRPMFYCVTAIAAAGAVADCLAPDLVFWPYVAGCWAMNLVIKSWIAAHACRCNAEARRTNTLEMLLVTPLTTHRIVQGQIQGLQRLFTFPVFTVLAIELLGMVPGIISLSSGNSTPTSSDTSIVILGTGFYLAVFVVDALAVAWAGMWFGLSSRKESQAVTKTILYVLIAPYLSLLFVFCFCPAIAVCSFGSVFWIIWATNRLQSRFREMATQIPGYVTPHPTLLPVPPLLRRSDRPLPPIQG
jgi:hypothetical protein